MPPTRAMPQSHQKDEEIAEWNRNADEQASRDENAGAQLRETDAHPGSSGPSSGQREGRFMADPKWIVSIAFVAAILTGAGLSGNWALAIYTLSFWHYYVYWLAFRYGAVPLAEFKRHAVALKIVSLLALESVYLAAPLHWLSLVVIACGFLLNSLAAKALGSDRTYYGHEVAGLPRRMITAFPYSWVSHPMLVGNIAAFGGTLLNPEFRRQWWPLAVAHVAMNAGLLFMEVAVAPLRRGADPEPAGARGGGLLRGVLFAAAGGALGVVWAACMDGGRGGAIALGAILGAWIAIHVFLIYRRYAQTSARPGPGRAILPKTSL